MTAKRLAQRTIAATEGYVSAVPLEARFGFGGRTAGTVDVRIAPPPGSPTGATDLRGLALDRMVAVSGSC